MAKAKVINRKAATKVVDSIDACTIVFRGNPRRPEPHHGIIKFPGGSVEVARCSDGKYWAHIHIYEGSKVTNSRIQRPDHEIFLTKLPGGESTTQIAVCIDGDRMAPADHDHEDA